VVRVDIRTLMRIDNLIRKEATGSPSSLGKRLGLSERAAYNYLKFMKEELNAPIEFSKVKGSYRYASKGQFNFKWKLN